jgi:hypothetical protein
MTWLQISQTCLAHDQMCGEATHIVWTAITSFCVQILDSYTMETDTNFIQGILQDIQHDDHCNTSDIPVLCPVNLSCVTFHCTELSVLQFHLNGYMTLMVGIP